MNANDPRVVRIGTVFVNELPSLLREDHTDLDLSFAQHPEYFNESVRVHSFVSWPSNKRQQPRALAGAGFFSTGFEDRVKCFYCGITLHNWDPEDEPWEEHARHRPQCEWLLKQKGRRFIDAVTKKYRNSGDFPDKNTISLDGLGNLVKEDFVFSALAKSPNYCSETTRRESFANWPSCRCQKPDILAQAGFFSRGLGDHVQCFYCGTILGNWDPHDEPWEEHARHSPRCQWLVEQKGKRFIDDVTKKYHGVQDSLNVDTTSRDGFGNFTKEGQLLKFLAKHRQYCSQERRRNSFFNWPGDRRQQPDTLAHAGFFSNGIGDRVTCFCCGITAINWQPEDEPWEEHARHSPSCKWLLKQKGQHFVDEVQRKYAPKPTYSTVPSTSRAPKFETTTYLVRQNALPRPLPATPKRSNARDENNLVASRETEEITQKMEQIQIKGAPAVPEELEKLREKMLCKICLDEELTVVFHPCKHMVSCKDCADKIATCPICRTHIDEKVQVFMS